MKKILVLTDFSKKAERATALALRIAKKTNSEILLYNAFEIPITEAYPYYEAYELIEKQNLGRLQRFGVNTINKVVKSPDAKLPKVRYLNEPGSVGSNIKGLLHYQKNVWLIIMGYKNKSEAPINTFIFGSNTYEVIANAQVPILFVSEKQDVHYIKTIAFASELAEDDIKAMETIVNFASPLNARIIVTHVCRRKLSIGEKVNHLTAFNKVVKKINYEDVAYEDIVGENTTKALARFCKKEHIDLLVMQHKKYPFFERLFHSSVTWAMQQYQNIPLLLLPPKFS